MVNTMRNTSIEFIYEAVVKYPDNICIEDDQEILNFYQFFYRAYTIASILRHSNTINQPIIVYLPKSLSAVISFAGVLLSGNFYVPVDIKSPQQRIRKIVDNIDPYRIFSKRYYQKHLESLNIPEEKIIYEDDINFDTGNTTVDKMITNCKKTTDRIIDMDPCYVMHTSGSTGTPKGVVVPHRGVIDYIDWAVTCFEVDENEVIGNQAPLYFDNSTLDIYLSWATGARLHIIPESTFLFPVKLIEYLEKHIITFVFFVPSVLVSISQVNLLTPGRLPSLRKIIFAGEVMPTKHLACWQRNLPERMYVNLYGPTEITVDCTYFIVDRIYEPTESLPIGYPCLNSGTLILNEAGELADIGEKGELCVRGSSLALGYWNNDEKSREVFKQNPLQTHFFDRIYRTGDIVYKNEQGRIMYVGRKDSQIKHMGYRIELGEIENAALTLDDVTKCCVLYNEHKKEITLFYEGNREIPVSEFRTMLSKILPTYMIPRLFYFMDILPMNPTGKINRKILKNRFTS